MERLFWNIFNTKDEDELREVVQNDPLLSNDNNWFPYGGSDPDDTGNFSTFENQQPEPVPALVEKITNSIDAILLKECRKKNIEPSSTNAPNSMLEAVEKFYNIKNGDFSELLATERRELAENIQIIASGDKSNPTILIYDDGEGQYPDDFPGTFLSLHKRNKVNVKFVQGKYNMGSTGAVVFCGEERYQLIASKRASEFNGNNDVGFTLVRRNPLTGVSGSEVRHSWYEYFIIDQKKIPRFKCNSMDVGLWNRKFKSGTIIKLFSYQLPPGSRSDIERDLWRDLNQFLYSPALTLLLWDARKKKNKSPTTPLLGNRTRILLDDRGHIEQTIPISFFQQEMGGADMEVTVFKHSVKQTEFIKDKAVVFTLNGQVQGSLPRRFISKDLVLGMLRDSLLINVDCTKLIPRFRQDLFMANRSILKKGNKLEKLLEIIKSSIKECDILKELNQNRKEQIIHEKSTDDKLLRELINSMPLDKEFLGILKQYGELNFFNKSMKPTKKKSNKEKKDKIYESKRFPSIFQLKIKPDSNGKKIKTIPLNGKGILKFETDVEDEYFLRPYDKGELKLEVLGIKRNGGGGLYPVKPSKVEEIFDVIKTGPSRNSIKVSLKPQKNISVGDEIEINTKLSCPGNDLESVFYIRIIDPQKKDKNPKQKTESQPTLPTPIKVFEKKHSPDISCWDDYGWDGDDVLKIMTEEDRIEAIAINMDSFALKKYISKKRIKDEKTMIYTREKYFVNIFFNALFLYSIFNKLDADLEKALTDGVDELLPKIFKPFSSFLLYMDLNEYISKSLQS
ncbi:MAG: hypothetical protein K8S16_03115 [Bacteroidales bacterium]|nr:hypothetical protein [Bacteroidales bacterium]